MTLTPRKPVVGYCDRLSAAPGEPVRFMVSCYAPGTYRADIVRVICAEQRAIGGGFEERVIDTPVNGDYPGREQAVHPGSYGVVEHAALEDLASFCVQVGVFPTAVGRGVQSLLACGFALFIDERGALTLRVGESSELSLPIPLEERRWARVTASYDAETGESFLRQEPVPVSQPKDAIDRTKEARANLGPEQPAGSASLLFAASHTAERPNAFFDGKLDSPKLFRDAGGTDALAEWDFAHDIASETLTDRSGNGLHGHTVNLPTRAVTGAAWTGEVQEWRRAPEQYAAIHFHRDDIADAGWEADFTFTVPDALTSGVYAARLRMADGDDYVPFYVRPPRGRATADVCFLAPTATYLAYANQSLHLQGGGVFGSGVANPVPNDQFLLDHREIGLSQYDYHSDGSGVAISSLHRPILNLKAKHTPWCFTADTHITAWLERKGFAFDVVTDEDLHREGVALLARYRTVITGSHPEYYSTAMLDAVDAYLGQGGRLMYMGGNGFYWRIAFHPRREGVIEVRRAEDGTRAWIAEPGEYYHQWTAEYGGLWRRLGRAPNQLVGIGFAAQGFDGGSPYRKTAAADDARASFVFKGVSGERFGDFGMGASGLEIDRWDPKLGSPRHALVLAVADEHPVGMLRTAEEFHMTEPPRKDPAVRSDMVFFECPNGGAVFATGSIAWAGHLAYQGYDNDVARITGNVLERFADPTPFALPEPPEAR